MNTRQSLDTLCAALAYAMGVDAPAQAAAANAALCDYIDESFGAAKADRLFMYNPDAIADWVAQKYAPMLAEAVHKTDIAIPFETVMPSVTPVCFGTMYTGAQPAVHGIQAYTKPVIRIDTLFDALLRNGKTVAIVSTANDSMSKIYLERDLSYFIYDAVEEVNAKAAELIVGDTYDVIAVYNGNYDAYMHKFGPESPEALGELRANSRTFGMFAELIETCWRGHNTLLGFAMDHGCHEIDGGCGSHGLAMDEDLHITHLYKALARKEDEQ